MAVKTIAEYINELNEDGQRYVRDFSDFIETEYPELRGRICFAMPMWLAGKKMRDGYVAISAAKKHFSIHFHDEEFVKKLGKRLPACKTGKRCINIKYNDDESYREVKESILELLSNF